MASRTPLTIRQLGDRLDLECRQGSTLGPIDVELTDANEDPFDLTGYTVHAMVRKEPTDPTPEVTFESALVGLPSTGQFSFWIDSAEMTLVHAAAPFTRYKWDLELVHTDGNVIPLYYGELRVVPEITHPDTDPVVPEPAPEPICC